MLMAKIACLAFSTPQLSELWHMPRFKDNDKARLLPTSNNRRHISRQPQSLRGEVSVEGNGPGELQVTVRGSSKG